RTFPAPATSVERFSTAHRLPITQPSPTTDPTSRMTLAARQFSMTHQLRPTLPSITWEPPPPLTAVGQFSTMHRLLVTRPSPTKATSGLGSQPSSTVHRPPIAQSLSLMG